MFRFRRKKPKLIELLLPPDKTQIIQPEKTGFRHLMTKAVASIANADEQFQHFVQTKIDPLLGKTRNVQMQEFLKDEEVILSAEERSANQQAALGVVTSGVTVLAHFVFAPLISAVILLGLLMVFNMYFYAYLELRRTQRLGAIHLACIYMSVLWLGGYATIGAFSMLMFGMALKVKALTERQSRNNLINVFQFQPKTVWIRQSNPNPNPEVEAEVEIEIPFTQLQIGDTMVLLAGQIIPVDGTISAGMATVDQQMLTGESQPIEKQIGDPVMASTVVISGKIEVCVEKTGKETTAGRIGDILNQAAQHNAVVSVKAVELADRFATPTLALSVLSWPIIGPIGAVCFMGSNYTRTTYISAPLAVLNFLNVAAAHGILVKDGSGLEQINAVDTIVFDKTGTLTIEQPYVAQIHRLTNLSEEAVLRFAAAAEVRQTHPIALAILAAAKERQLELPPIDQAHYEVGYGIKVWLADASIVPSKQGIAETEDANFARQKSLIRVGSGRFMIMEGIILPEQVKTLIETSQVHGNSLVMVALDDELVGCIELQPTVRSEAQQIIDGLRNRGLALVIISGDQEKPTRKLAHQLGITRYFANTLPETKADLVTQLQQEGCQVCFIGDGINDAIAMHQADVSISLRGATTAATDTAQIILMEGNLNQLLYLFQLAEQFDRNLQRNIRFTSGMSLISMTGILLGGFTFVATEFLYNTSLLVALGIAMKPLLDHQKSGEVRETASQADANLEQAAKQHKLDARPPTP